MSRKQAIDGFCRECIADSSQPGTWRSQVEACTSKNCHLHAYRPVSYGNPTASTHIVRTSILASELAVFHKKSDCLGGAL